MLMRIPTFLMLFFVVVVIALNLDPSGMQQVWIWSYFRFSFIVALSVLALYFLASVRVPGLLRINVQIFSIGLGIFLGVELFLRIFPDRLPTRFLQLLPPETRQKIALDRGAMTEGILAGQGMEMWYQPHFQSASMPWLHIDAKGYRNPEPWPQAVDMVLLGDSLAIGQASSRDLAQMARDESKAAINLGFNGYAPQHLLAAYRRHVVNPALPHRYVVMSFCSANDLYDARRFAELEREGKSWREFLSDHTGWGHWPAWINTSYTLSAILKLPYMLRTGEKVEVVGGTSITLPGKALTAPENFIYLADYGPESTEWTELQSSYRQIIDYAHAAKAKVIIVFMPNEGLLYGPYSDQAERYALVLKSREQLLQRFRQAFAGPDVVVIDPTDAVVKAMGHRQLVAYDLDFHLNEAGYQIVYDQIRPWLEPARWDK